MNELAIKQFESLISDTDDEISILSNASAFIKELMDDTNWVGFYLNKEEVLYLGPFQGKVACTVIEFTKGVCGHCATTRKPVIVEDVHQFPGHIACDSASNSELVIPIIINERLYGLLDLDSPSFARFKKEDEVLLEKMMEVLADRLGSIL
ncbi:MAG: GAF domain-containing protein [Erysipelotrichaceae bacterium]|jgi:L-methionine (R)-S-oxide reductase|nr:GAF domain-containing protein [Erysipelotrichaceae bacterium]